MINHLFLDPAAVGQVTPVVIVSADMNREAMVREYVGPGLLDGLHPNYFLALSTMELAKGTKKPKIVDLRSYLEVVLVPAAVAAGVKYMLVNDALYYKELTGSAKADADLGYVRPCKYGDFNVLYIPNYRTVFTDPKRVRGKISQAIQAMVDHQRGRYTPPGESIIHSAEYPRSVAEIATFLSKLLAMKCDLTADIEGFSLKPYLAGIGSISFAWDQHNGGAFPIDISEGITEEGHYFSQLKNDPVRQLLKSFFVSLYRQGNRLIWHNASYDVMVLIYQLFMDDLLDQPGLHMGLEIMLTHWDCTKLITYLATNSTAGNHLSLKEQAQEFAGNWAVADIKDIRKIRVEDLLRYNLVDSLSTWYVYNKHWPTLVADNQEEIYLDLFKPAQIDIVQMQLTGLPVNMPVAIKVAAELRADQDAAEAKIQAHPLVQHFTFRREREYVEEFNTTRKIKRITINDALGQVPFNPNSDPQLQRLLYEIIGLPVVERTKTRAPATDADTLKALKSHTEDPQVKALLDYVLDFKAVCMINQTFIPPILNAVQGPDGWHYLLGNFNLGGTLSGRLSSSGPNLQNIPATGSRYAKKIKMCFSAPPGWLFMGLDFDSLEDRISALTTKDPNKLKVYTDGYDGHCLRAYAYFGDQMPDIDSNSVDSINSIADKYKPLRQESKAPTFALTYQGTWKTLVKNCGFSQVIAMAIESSYQEMYQVSIDWVNQKLNVAAKTGYVTLAFGLRLRTPLLRQSVRGTSKTPASVEAEGRSAGNALGQSWCLLNSRAAIGFLRNARKSDYRYDIKPCAQIHDAQYYLVRDTPDTVSYFNVTLVPEVQWQDDPDIWHDEVKLGGSAFVCYPDWSSELTIPNGLTGDEMVTHIRKQYAKYLEKQKQ